MNSKFVANALIVACLISLAAWWRWHVALPPAKPPTMPTNSQQLARAPSPPTDIPADNQPPEPGSAKIDPATLTSLADALTLTSLTDALTRARSNPNSDPQAIDTLEYLSSGAAESAGGANVGLYGRITFSTADDKGQQSIDIDAPMVIINNITGAATLVDHGVGTRNPDGSTTWTSYDANDKVLMVSTHPATNPATPAPTP